MSDHHCQHCCPEKPRDTRRGRERLRPLDEFEPLYRAEKARADAAEASLRELTEGPETLPPIRMGKIPIRGGWPPWGECPNCGYRDTTETCPRCAGRDMSTERRMQAIQRVHSLAIQHMRARTRIPPDDVLKALG